MAQGPPMTLFGGGGAPAQIPGTMAPGAYAGGAYAGGAYAGGMGMGGAAGAGGGAVQVKNADADQCGCGVQGSADTGGAQTCGVDGGPEANVLHEKGHGQGEWVAETTYKSVAPGTGTFARTPVVTKQEVQFHMWWWIVPILLILLTLWILLFWGCQEWRNTWLGRNEQCGGPAIGPEKCMFWGDPHFWTFDNVAHEINYKADAYPNGDFWIIKSKNVWIQGRYRPTNWLMKNHNNDRACARAIGFGGPFLQNNKLIVEAMQKSTKSTTDDGQITYNGSPILTTMGSSFTDPQGLVRATYSNAGVPLDVRMHMQLQMVTLDLPQQIHVVVNRWKEHIDGQISMPKKIPGMQGHCGNYDGNPADDQSNVADAVTGAHKPLEDIKIATNDPQLIFEPTVFIEQHNFPPEVSEQDTFNARIAAIQD